MLSMCHVLPHMLGQYCEGLGLMPTEGFLLATMTVLFCEVVLAVQQVAQACRGGSP